MTQNTGLIAIAFPSYNPVRSRRLKESQAKASRFGSIYRLGEARVVAKDTYGYIVPANLPLATLSEASKCGGRVIPFQEMKRKAQGIEAARGDTKNRDSGRPHSGPPSAKVKSSDYGKTSPIKEGKWVSLGDYIEGYRIEMAGTQPVGRAEKGRVHPGNYYVLGIREARDGDVVTLGCVDSIAKLGSSKEGRYVFNVDYDALSKCVEECDPSMVKAPDAGGVISPMKKQVSARELTRGKKKREGILGAAAGAAQTPQREGVVTEGSVHGRGIQILKHLGMLKSKTSDSSPTPPMTTSPMTPVGRKVLEENQGVENESIPRPVSVGNAMGSGQQEGHAKAVADLLVSGQAGGKLSGGPFDTPLPPSVEQSMRLFRSTLTNAAAAAVPSGVASTIQESHVGDAMGGAESLDPEDYAQGRLVAAALAEQGVDPEEATDEEIEAILARMENNEEDDEERGGDRSEAEEEEDGDELEEDLIPGDLSAVGGLVGLLKSRGYANPETVAAKLEAGAPAEEWFGLAGQSLQDCKRLQWAWVQRSRKGHY